MTPPCTTQRAKKSQSKSRFHRIQMNILVVFLSLVEQDWCEAILEQMLGSTSLGRDGAFSELKEQFHSGRTLGCQWSHLADGTLSSKSHRLWSDLLWTRRCLHYHPHKTPEKETSQYTPQLVKTVVKEIMKVESSKQIRSLTCCSMTIFSKSHLVVQSCQHNIQSSRKILIVDSIKIKSEPLTWPVRKSEKQPEPWCISCTWNLAILILGE